MKNTEENLRSLLRGLPNKAANAGGEHLRDEDFVRLIEAETSLNNGDSATNGNASALAPLRRHLADCEKCLDDFQDFYAFYAVAAENEPIAAKAEIDAAWQQFAPRIAAVKPVQNQTPNFWARLFPAEKKANYFGAFGWGLAAILLVLSGIAFWTARQAANDKSELTAQLENQKQVSEARLKSLEQAAQNRDQSSAQEKNRSDEERNALQQQIAKLQTELARAKQPFAIGEITPPKNSGADIPPANDNSLIAVNTPIYDVFPGDSIVRGENQLKNNLSIPKDSKSIVLILNAAGSRDFPSYRAQIFDASGKTVWRGANLKKDNLGNFTLTLSRTALKNGSYRLKIYSQTGGQTAPPVIEYPLTIAVK